MDNIDAPQWADLVGASPQVSLDDFFLRKHETHEYRSKLDIMDTDSPKQPFNVSSANETVFEKTPVRPKRTKTKSSSCKKSKGVKETTYEKVLTEAMNNLQLSFKKSKNDKSLNKSCLMDSPTTFKTPKRITRSMCAQAATPKCDLDESHYVSLDEDDIDVENEAHCEDNKENDHVKEHNHVDKNNEKIDYNNDNSIHEQTSQTNLKVTDTNDEKETSNEKPEIEFDLQTDLQAEKNSDSQTELEPVENNEKIQSKLLPKSVVVTAFTHPEQTGSGNSKKKVTALTGNAWHRQIKRRISLSNQRQISVHKNTVAGKYVSMAEAITKFQRATPQRFHSVNVKPTRAEVLKRQSFKLTKATSPALMSKNRIRPVRVLSREEQERLELEKIRQNQIKANPVRKDILIKPAPLKKVEKKMVTNPEPFHLTQVKKYQPPQKTSNPVQDFKKLHRPHMKTVPSIVSTKEKSVIIKEEEVLHFGIPLEPVNMKKKTTKVKPFSFEARNKELQMKKQEKLKQLQQSEKEQQKVEFHARPVPTAVKTPSYNKLPQRPASANKPVKKITIARSLSFEERHKELQKKKEEKMKQMLEEEKKARTFRAQKVPEFKPVMVRGRSRDNLLKKSHENLSAKSEKVSVENKKVNTISSKQTDGSLKKSHENLLIKKSLLKKPTIPFVAAKKVSPPSKTTENQENKHQGVVPKILEPKCKLSQKSVAVLSELNTDKRAKERKEFEEQIKKKETELEEMRKKEENERLERERAENLQIRKKMEIKARPMPVYKQLNIVKSTKPLTEAQSPAWAKRKGSMH